MPDTDQASRSEPAGAQADNRNLPMPVAQAAETGQDGFFSRILRTLFGWRAGSIRADLEVVLEAGALGETGFSPEESTMLKNILGLRKSRVADVMVPRADITAVQQNPPLGDLLKLFKDASHSRLVA